MALIAFPRARRALRGLRGTAAKRWPQSQSGTAPAQSAQTRPSHFGLQHHRPRKWLLLYNCHFLGLAHCLHLLSDEVEVEAYRPTDPGRGEANFSRNGRLRPVWERPLEQYETILVFPPLMKQFEHLGLAERKNVVTLPSIFFDGFHPDFCNFQYRANSPDSGIRLVPGTHSLIGAMAFQAGLNIDQTLALYHQELYERLGYFDRWDPAREALLASFANAGFDLREPFLNWGRQGVFMHTLRHPRIHCLRDLALILLERFEARVSPCQILPPDNLVQSPVDPVYPELGRRLGVPGSYRFKQGATYETVDLRSYLEEQFARYRSGNPFELAYSSRHLQPAADTLREILA